MTATPYPGAGASRAPHRASPVLACVLLSALAAPAWPQPHVERPDAMLNEARTAPALRAALIAHARSVMGENPSEAADALLYAGASSERSGLPDSAAICYREAAGLRRSTAESLALVDVLLLHARARDLIEAYEVVNGLIDRTPPGAFGRADVMRRSMWVQHLAGHADSAAVALREASGGTPLEGIWQLRTARVLLEDVKDGAAAQTLLFPLEARSHGQDAEVHDLFVRAAATTGAGEAAAMHPVYVDLEKRRAVEDRLLRGLDARRIAFRADDGFLLSSVVRPALPGAPAAIVLSRGDTLAHYDSLIVHLHEAGFAVMLVEPRGYGESVGPPCAAPMRWEGRQHAMEEALARDAVAALGALGELGPVDTTHAVIVGAGFTARAAVRAAELRPDFRAIVLASAEPARVDRGLLIGSVARVQRPIFFQTAPEDLVDLYYYTDALYQAGDRRASRVSSGTSIGRYAEQFNHDPKSGLRLRQWLDDLRTGWTR